MVVPPLSGNALKFKASRRETYADHGSHGCYEPSIMMLHVLYSLINLATNPSRWKIALDPSCKHRNDLLHAKLYFEQSIL